MLESSRSRAATSAALAEPKTNLLSQWSEGSDDADYRTPWERGHDAEIADYELTMIRRSASNMHALGLGA